MLHKLILEGIDPPPSCLPRQLDKPTYTKMSQSYADILKKQFSLTPHANQATIATTRTPHKQQATILDYDLTQLTEYPPLKTKATNLSSNTNAVATTTALTTTAATDCTMALLELKNEISMLKTSMKPLITTPTTVDYATELVALKQDLQSLRTFITTAVEQLTMDIASLHAAPVVGNMETTLKREFFPNPYNRPTILIWFLPDSMAYVCCIAPHRMAIAKWMTIYVKIGLIHSHREYLCPSAL